LTLLAADEDNIRMAAARISRDELKRRLDDTTADAPVILDVRLKYPYEHSTVTLPGALRVPPGRLDPSVLPRNRELVLYDSDPEELVSSRIAADLIRLGFRALVLEGGIAAWVAAKLPTASKRAPVLTAPAGALKG
jgi:rhodanese-related sulfurtransferase